ncbi:MAG: hypothetical protein M1355_04380 [Patescibacteria group bacterium]|nr:hypothetical protein [Patescibacteria group bacterium]
MKITEESTLTEVIKLGGENVLRVNGVPCVTCPLAAQEINSLTIGQVARIYKLDGDKIKRELNKLIKEKC